MDIESKLILRRKETYLRENLEIHRILPRLYQEGVISDDDRERIEKEDTTRDRISKFLRIIKRKLDGYSKLLEVLVVEKLNFIREELESTEIDEDTLKKEQELDENFVREHLSILYRESEGESISYNSLKEDIQQIKYLEGKDSRTEEEFLVRSVKQNFPTVKYEERYSSNTEMAYVFRNLVRRSTEDSKERAVPEDDLQPIEAVVRDNVFRLFRESSDTEVPLSTLERDVKMSLPETEINFQNLPLKSIVQNAFPNVKYVKVKREKEDIYVFKNLTRTFDHEDGASVIPIDNRVNPHSQLQQIHFPRKPFHCLSEDELCRILEPKFLHSGIPCEILSIFKEQEIDGHAFKHFDIKDLSNIMDMPYGKKKAIMIIKDELITEENDQQKSETCRDGNPEVKCIKVREYLRRFDTPSAVLGSYRKSAFVSTNVTRIHNLIQPVHMFIDYNDNDLQNIEACLARLTMNFASACMNERTNGTIHFGIKALTDDGQMDGEIVGIRANKDECNKAIKICLREQFFEDQIEMAWKCIRSPQFIRVVEPGNSPPCFVVEIDVVPNAALLEDEAVFVRETTLPDSKPTLLRLKEGTSTPEIQNNEQIRQYMKIKSRLHKQRKDEEEKPQYVQLNENLRQKFLNVFSGGDSFLADETYNILITSPGDDNLKNEIAENNLFKSLIHMRFLTSILPQSLTHCTIT